MARQLKKQGLAAQWKHTQRQWKQRGEEEKREQEDNISQQQTAKGKRKPATAVPQPPVKKQKGDAQPELSSSSTRFFSLLSDPAFAASAASASSSASSAPSSALDALDLSYLEDKLGLSAAAGQSKTKLRREMAEDGLDELFELVEGIESGMTEAQRRRVRREEGIGEDEYEEMMGEAAEARGGGSGDESEAEGSESEDESQLMPEPDEQEMARYYPHDDDEEQMKSHDENGDLDEEEEEEEEGDAEREDSEQQSDDDESGEGPTDEDGHDDGAERDRTPHHKLTRDELYGFNAPTPQSLIDFKTSGQTTTKAATAASSASSAAPAKYVPPHLRNKTPAASSTAIVPSASSSLLSTPPADAALLPRLTGLLNRLNEQNVEPIAAQLLPLFDAHSRSAVNNTLAVAVLTQLVGATADSLASTFVVSVSGLLFLLHYTEEHGTAAYVVEHTLTALRNILHSASASAPSPALTAAGVNAVNFLCHLYLFGVSSSTALFDLLALFSASLTPLHVELLSTVLSHTGAQLRKHDPTQLKDVVLALHRSAAALSEAEREGRVGYLVGLMNDVKNNRVRQHAAADAMTPLHNALLNVVKRRMGKRVGYDESRRLTFGYEDVGRIDERGRWWIVGAAYKGAVEGESGKGGKGGEQRKERAEVKAEASVVDAEGDVDYAALARAQGYHLPFDVRVFCILLSSVDYLQAAEALDKLNIRQGSQWRSVVSILIDCVRRSRHYNPYFAHVTAHLCQFVRPARFTVQLALWDTLTALAALPATTQPPPAQQANAVGRYVAQLAQSAHGSTVWAVWRHVEWGDGTLSGTVLECVRATVEAVLGSAEGRRGDETVRYVFGPRKAGQEAAEEEKRARKGGGAAEEEERVREGLLMFLSKHMEPAEPRKGKKRSASEELMAKRVKLAKEAVMEAL